MAINNIPLPPGSSDDTDIDDIIREIYSLNTAGLVTRETSITDLVSLISISNPRLVPALLRFLRDPGNADCSANDYFGVPQLSALDNSIDGPTPVGVQRQVSIGRESHSGTSSEANDGYTGAPTLGTADDKPGSGEMEKVEVDALLNNDNEKRTTVMIKKIPRRFTVSALRDLIERECPALRNGGYDLLYLPVDTAKVANRGYAFINFTTPRYLLVFTLVFQGYEWFPQRRRRSDGPAKSSKACEIYFAHIQGRDATIRSVDPTGSKRSNSPNYESIGNDKVWILGFTDSRKKKYGGSGGCEPSSTTTTSSPPRMLSREFNKPTYARCLSNASTSSNTTTPRGESQFSFPLLNRAISSSTGYSSATFPKGCNRRPINDYRHGESSNSRARDF
ncbi:hypothetical protein FOL47_002316 [Perkinsus chesapeaki]|uniref:Mei2-like C-terminal RNA recognition motif domain-containing protein n=1 Tax=Perkinsus chesapeaki TaxID=330153 RepID=A0A7J6MEA3_PERCH|nr:hypothetical protein FOL47_002316 [Perkinsus chesapeaki]